MQTLNDLKGSLNNPHLYFKYSNTDTEVTHVTCQSLKFFNKPGQVLDAKTLRAQNKHSCYSSHNKQRHATHFFSETVP